MFCLLSVFVLSLLTHNSIRTNKEGGAHFLGPRGVKYLNTGLAMYSMYFQVRGIHKARGIYTTGS
jgi:hypothetical protein